MYLNRYTIQNLAPHFFLLLLILINLLLLSNHFYKIFAPPLIFFLPMLLFLLPLLLTLGFFLFFFLSLLSVFFVALSLLRLSLLPLLSSCLEASRRHLCLLQLLLLLHFERCNSSLRRPERRRLEIAPAFPARRHTPAAGKRQGAPFRYILLYNVI